MARHLFAISPRFGPITAEGKKLLYRGQRVAWQSIVAIGARTSRAHEQ